MWPTAARRQTEWSCVEWVNKKLLSEESGCSFSAPRPLSPTPETKYRHFKELKTLLCFGCHVEELLTETELLHKQTNYISLCDTSLKTWPIWFSEISYLVQRRDAGKPALINSLKEMELSPFVSASCMVLSAILPSWSSEMFTPTIIRRTWKEQVINRLMNTKRKLEKGQIMFSDKHELLIPNLSWLKVTWCWQKWLFQGLIQRSKSSTSLSNIRHKYRYRFRGY